MCCDKDDILFDEPQVLIEDDCGNEIQWPGRYGSDPTPQEYQVVKVRLEGGRYSRDRIVLVVNGIDT